MSKALKLFIFVSAILVSNFSLAYHFYSTGNHFNVKTSTTLIVCLAGGGNDDDWSDGWRRMLQSANGGDIVIIRADDNRGSYEDWIYNDTSNLNFPKVSSVQTIVLNKSSDGNSDFLVNKILNAELIFFAGGDQSNYVNILRDSKVLKALQFMLSNKGIPFGGTSAGMAFLGGIDYTSQFNSPRDHESNVNSDDVMDNPTGKFVDLENNILIPPFMENILTDTHFSNRERQGRLVGFMARAVYNQSFNLNYSTVKAIASDESTAFCYDQNGIGKVYGFGSVFFLKGNLPIEQIAPFKKLHWYENESAVKTYEIKANTQNAYFDMKNWTGVGGIPQFWWVDSINSENPSFGIRY